MVYKEAFKMTLLLIFILYILIGVLLTARAYFKVPLGIKQWGLLDQLVVCVGMTVMWLPLVIRDVYIISKQKIKEKRRRIL